MQQNPPSQFTRVRRAPQRGAYDLPTIHAILDAGTVCHIGHVIDGRPVVTPVFYWRHENQVYWHASTASRMVRAALSQEVCLTVSLLDEWVLARSAFHHSANYRSVVCFGRPTLIEDREAKLAAMRGFLERLFPGRWERLRPPTEQEIKATAILSLALTEASAKVRTGPPVDDPEDLSWPIWVGRLPLHTIGGPPIAAPDMVGTHEPPATPV
jgi:hypothetical protein